MANDEQIPPDSQSFMETWQTDFELDMEGLNMVFFAMPDMPPEPVVETMQVAKASSATASSSVRKMTYGICDLSYATEEDWQERDSSVNSLAPTSYMNKFLSPKLQNALDAGVGAASMDWQWYGKWTESFKITLLRAPQHGKFVNMKNDPYGEYLPNRGYYGKDRIDLLIEGKDDLGRPISMTLRYYINVLPRKELHKIASSGKAFGQYIKKYCGTNNPIWRISQPTLEDYNTPDSWYRATSLAALLDRRKRFADLSGSALGSTTGGKTHYELGVIWEDIDMWQAEPPTSLYEAPVYVAANVSTPKSQRNERILGSCLIVETMQVQTNKEDMGIGEMEAIRAANFYMEQYEGKADFFGDGSHTTVTLLQPPAHGELDFIHNYEHSFSFENLDPGESIFNARGLMLRYIPEVGYTGKDFYVIEFEQNGVKVKTHDFVVVDYYANMPYVSCNTGQNKLRKNASVWKISHPSVEDYNTPDSWYRATSLYALLTSAKDALTGFADLAGSALGSTTNGKITLDADAAGYSWYIDPTPYQNEEWLPTSNPLEWVAKPDSEAKSKMGLGFIRK
ncbi:MAG: hypothetical protein LBU53_05520 [Zoogloeaceae bacterium]|jgi:hypothetical protein|nr:hypothetical protein [Zoogloeaceae bacterium]